MTRNRLIVVALGIFLASFLVCGGIGLWIRSLGQGSDTGAQAKNTPPATTAPRPTEVAKATVPKTMPKATLPVTAPVGPRKGEMPPDADLRQLVTNSLLDLDGAIKAKDFNAFHRKLAGVWQSDKGKKDIQAFVQGINTNLAAVKDVAPVFKPAPMLSDGLLTLEGHFPAKNLRVEFKFQYVFEQAAWKLKDIAQLNMELTMENQME